MSSSAAAPLPPRHGLAIEDEDPRRMPIGALVRALDAEAQRYHSRLTQDDRLPWSFCVAPFAMETRCPGTPWCINTVGSCCSM
jgi:hypothetical protein